MKLHEYQAKSTFSRYGIPIPRGRVASVANEAKLIAEELGGRVVVKAQVQVNGRGKAGGIRLAKTPEEAEDLATMILGMELKGLPVRKILVDEAVSIDKEMYMGITNDRNLGVPVMKVSATGGVDVEETANQIPNKMITTVIDPLLGLCEFQVRDIAVNVDLPREYWRQFILIAMGLWKVYVENDATLAEINPLVITTDRRLLALDCKMTIDNYALFRHPDLADKRDLDSEPSPELEARKYGLSYIKMDGNIGVMVNGAGLAMAVTDIIRQMGGKPANFLDIGGGAGVEKAFAALRIILSNPTVKVILINIFGGITRCDDVARGCLQALREIRPDARVVIRLVGTNSEEANHLLRDANLTVAETLIEAVQKAIALAAEG